MPPVGMVIHRGKYHNTLCNGYQHYLVTQRFFYVAERCSQTHCADWGTTSHHENGRFLNVKYRGKGEK